MRTYSWKHLTREYAVEGGCGSRWLKIEEVSSWKGEQEAATAVTGLLMPLADRGLDELG